MRATESDPPVTDIAPEIAGQAVDWLFELQEAGDATAPRQAFADWLAAHPEHRRAWEHIQRVNARLHQVAEQSLARRCARPCSAVRAGSAANC